MRKLKAFTIVELLVAMAIIGVILGLAVFGISAAQRNARDTQRKAALEDINAGIADYYNQYSAYPGALVLVQGSGSTAGQVQLKPLTGTCVTSGTGANCVTVPLTGPANPCAAANPLTTTQTCATTDSATRYCYNGGITGGYRLSATLESGQVHEAGINTTSTPKCQ